MGKMVCSILWDIVLFLFCICNLTFIYQPSIFGESNIPPFISYPMAISSLIFVAIRILEYFSYLRKVVLRAGR